MEASCYNGKLKPLTEFPNPRQFRDIGHTD